MGWGLMDQPESTHNVEMPSTVNDEDYIVGISIVSDSDTGETMYIQRERIDGIWHEVRMTMEEFEQENGHEHSD